jgi:hypothetical protein
LLDGLGVGVNVKFVLYQFSRNSRHINKLPCEDIPIFLEEFDKSKFLFRIQVVPHMDDLRGLAQGQRDGLAELLLGLDGYL